MTRTTVLEIVQDDILPALKDTVMEEALRIMIKGYEALCEIDDLCNMPALPNYDFEDKVVNALDEYKYGCNYTEDD